MALNASFALLLVACLSCSGSTLGGSGGAGGNGAGGSGATGGLLGAESRVPRCLADLVAPCACQGAPNECGPQTCHLAGVATVTTQLDGGTCPSPDDHQENRVYGPTGSLCYTVRAVRGPAPDGCSFVTIEWFDPAGNMVASAAGLPGFDACVLQTPQVTCTATGETGTVPIWSWPTGACGCA